MMYDDLLDIAARLATLEEGRPRRTSLRRAISSAYYALFHALAALCANELVGYSKHWDFYSPIYRTLDHGRAKDVFKRISNSRGSKIAFLGQVFILLQERRFTADEQVRQAIVQINKLPDDERLFLATQLIARTRP
jgi:hypothetical protein